MPTTSSGSGTQSPVSGQNPPAKVAIANPLQVDVFDPQRQPLIRWLQRLEGAFRVFQISEGAERVAYLLHFVGVEPFGILCDRLDPIDPYTQTYETLIGKLKEFYAPEPLEIAEIYIYRKRMQRTEETVQEYMAALQKLSLHCKFGEYLPMELRNQFVFGLRNHRIQSRLLETANLTKDSALKIACGMEMAEKGVNKLKEENHLSETTVDYIGAGAKQKKTKGRDDRTGNRGNQQQGSRKDAATSKHSNLGKHHKYTNNKRSNSKVNDIVCYRCGQAHLAPSCTLPRNTKCRECGGFGHLQKVCKKKGQAHLLEEVFRVDDREHLEHREKYTVPLQIESKRVTFDVDCGSAVTLVSDIWRRETFPNLKLYNTRLKLRSYCKKNFVPLGFIKVKVKDINENKILNMYVVKYDRDPLLGREWINQLKMLKKIKDSLLEIEDVHTLDASGQERLANLLEKYRNVLSDEFANINKFQAHLKLKPNVKPVFIKNRAVPFKILEKVEKELENMVKAGILEKVESSNWATPIVPVLKKNGGIRICGDYSITVNPSLIIDEHPLPTMEELFASMSGGTIFSKIDLKQAYLQLPVAESDREILTLSTHKGLYKCNRLMYGVASAPAIWQRTMENILCGIPGVAIFLDDIRIAGKDIKQHCERLELVLKRLSEYNIRINVEKCAFLKDKISYCGYIISKNGISKEPKKIEAVQKMPRPTNTTQLRAFIGLVNYYGRFIEHLSDKMYPLNNLLKKNVKFNWSKECETAFRKIKVEFGSKKILVPFNPKLPLILAVDASPYGIGAVLSHMYPDGTERVIQYASNTLNETQKKYAQIDKEAFAIVFGIKKFHQFLYGNHFTLLTDNKPLAQILNPQKGLPAYSALRMQHYAVFLQAFNFDIKYRKSIDHCNADGFSRLPIQEKSVGKFDVIDVLQMENVETLPVTAKSIRDEINKDALLLKIRQTLIKGKSLVPLGYNDGEFALQDGIVFRKERIAIPKSLRSKVLKELHAGHFGTVKMKKLSRNFCWWPKIDKEIEEITKNCKACATFLNNPRIKVKHAWEAASEPFERVHIDFAGPFMSHTFLVLVDSYTKWPEVHIVKNMSVQNTIEKCREIFAKFGLPRVLVSDNGRTFIAEEFENFLRINGIYHKRTAPYHPATNGLAERFVQTLKKSLRKLNISNGNIKTNLQKFLFQYRVTPHAELDKSPAEAMYNRKLRSRLDLMFPKTNKEIEMENIIVVRNFKEGERVAVREYLNKNVKWRFGRVLAKLGKLHYSVKLDNGKIWKRHSDQIRKIGEKISAPIDEANNLGEADHYGPVEVARDVLTPSDNEQAKTVHKNSDPASSSCYSENPNTTESEEGEAARADDTRTRKSKISLEQNVNENNEGRPQRYRKPPDRGKSCYVFEMYMESCAPRGKGA
ncbi:uncharacterized protein K02A2.6-like [Nylanderia fulva]|uniref:uncharacterized protein K02A2.6-like n=2 Tax=Nylanderia fulva TaxID=613905 RepID=UPI0010FB709A|nr:uncharacterized protein K02A2.6-like [Nylanderia fulva]XP_029174497.1 uncharacterized protein K02A2.6-like [Nylanderia fulva]